MGLAVGGRADWPAARGGNGRSSAADTGPRGPLAPAWRVETGSPSPAWAAEARGSLWQKIPEPLVPRAADDLAPVPVIHRDTVLVGTTLDEVRALDLATGRLRWSHLCGAPVRYAPAPSGDLVVVGSDDGLVRALDLDTGAERWSARIGPDAPWIPGNGRLVSRHPVRTGPVVEDGIVLAAAGLFPLEGTYLAAFDLRDGALRWRRNLGNVSPQGYPAVAGPDVIVPAGRAAPRVYRRADGSFRRELPSSHGTLAVVSDDETFAGPGATGTLAAQGSGGARVVTYPGRHLAVTASTSFLLNDREVVALDRDHLRRSPGDAAGALRWRRTVPDATTLIVADAWVWVAAAGRIERLATATGEPGPALPAPDRVLALAAGREALVATTASGSVLAYRPPGSGPAPEPDMAAPPPPSGPAEPHRTPPPLRGWEDALAGLPSPRGWALWAAPAPGPSGVLPALAATELHWVVAVPPDAVAGWRRALADAGLLGRRASVVERRDGQCPSVSSGVFNLVCGDALDPDECRRLACPGASGLILRGGRAEPAPEDPAAGRWTHQYGDAGNPCSTAQPLRGAPRLRWFGGHGPERMPDRHTRGHAPLAAGGLIVSVAEDALIATDAHNGTVRWQAELPGSMRYALPYDAGYVVLSDDGRRLWAASDDQLVQIDTRIGSEVRRWPCPVPGRHWGWVARSDGRLLASACRPEAPRTRKEYELVDLDYRSERPLVLATDLLRVDESDGKPVWRVETPGAWVHATLAAADGRVFAVEAVGPGVRSDRTGRLPCAVLLGDARVVCLDADTGRRLWERPLRWPEARDILGLAVAGDRVILSCARSTGGHAAYQLRCWDARDGRQLWTADGLNPVEDLYHGQQVKRPVLLGDKVSFESALYDLADGRRWLPPGAGPDWILKRPGHACGGMTGTSDGLLFRADNPTFFRFADGSFTRLSPTRPGCWLNILPAAGGILIPEASASCICGYPLQTSMAFGFEPEPTPVLPDVGPR